MGEEYKRPVVVLGSVPALGPVVLYDDMEGLFKWAKTGTGADPVLEKGAVVCFNGSYGLHAKSRVTTPAAADYVKAARYFPCRACEKYSLELIWQMVSLGEFNYLDFVLWLDDGTTIFMGVVRYDRVNTLWKYRNAAGNYVEIPGAGQTFWAGVWNRLRFTIDLRTGLYVSVESCAKVFDVSALAMYTSASGGSTSGQVYITGVTVGAAACEFHVDDVLILEA